MGRWLKRIALLLLALAVLVAGLAWWLLRGSLAALDGDSALGGLSAPVSVQRDALGVVTIDAANEVDAMRALGYVHAQERYFEMDLMRRSSAGELSALFGPVALDFDRQRRVHRMRARVDAHLDAIAGERMPLLQAYADGANAGLAALRVRPWPYLLLGRQPQPWTAADTALAGYAMYFDLQDSGNARELALWKLRPRLPAPLFALLTQPGSSWDAPLFGEPFGDAVLPTADEVDLRTLPAPEAGDDDADAVALSPAVRERGVGWSPAAIVQSVALTPPFALRTVPLSPAMRERGIGWSPAAIVQSTALTPPFAPRTVPLSPAVRERGIGGSPAATDGHLPGSNNFAVSGALTADGRAIVADDMHLGLRAPNIWFRARLRWPDADAPGGRVDVQGVTLPGLPAVIVGSNGHVAWGYTNSYGDYLDWALETPCTAAAQPADGRDCVQPDTHAERIDVAGAEPVSIDVRETRWGPVLHALPDGRLLTLRWTAHQPGAVNLGLTALARAGDLDDALAIADRAGVPTQNLVIGDSGGRIAWRLLGPIPMRGAGCDPTVPTTVAPSLLPATTADAGDATSPAAPAGACRPWLAAGDASPLAASPAFDRLWTANARVVDGEALARIGDGGYDLGARARQIRDGLRAKQRFDERDLLAIQLDDRAVLMTRWHELLLASGEDPATPALRELAAAARDWSGRASVDSAGYRIVRAWRLAVHERILDGLVAPAQAAMGDAFETPWASHFEGVAWPLVRQRPLHLLPKRFDSWHALFEDAALQVRDELAKQGPLRERTWGEQNTAAICHPLAAAVPFGKRLLCMPADPLPGDAMMPRVQGPAFGASERMVVSPGREADGLMHMPGGQSGHPLSPFWGAGHDDWVHGRATPFLPGPPVHRLTLRP